MVLIFLCLKRMRLDQSLRKESLSLKSVHDVNNDRWLLGSNELLFLDKFDFDPQRCAPFQTNFYQQRTAGFQFWHGQRREVNGLLFYFPRQRLVGRVVLLLLDVNYFREFLFLPNIYIPLISPNSTFFPL